MPFIGEQPWDLLADIWRFRSCTFSQARLLLLALPCSFKLSDESVELLEHFRVGVVCLAVEFPLSGSTFEYRERFLRHPFIFVGNA
jgi:hypothetical protein